MAGKSGRQSKGGSRKGSAKPVLRGERRAAPSRKAAGKAGGGTGKSTGKRKGRSAPKSAKESPRGRTKRIFRNAFLALVIIALLAGGGLAWVAHDLPSTDDLSGPAIGRSMRIEAQDGSVIARFGEQWGQFTSLDAMAPVLPQAVVAVEDRRFFEHGALDIIGLARALWRNLTSGRVVEGGSTITQQLAKIMFLGAERTLKRKAQEALLAWWLERKFTKEEILTIYLNRVYLGAGSYGVDAAASRYFDKTPANLNLAEAAMIAGLLKAPSRLSPATNLKGARARAAVVLDTMVAAGFITETEADSAKHAPARPRPGNDAGGDARYFADWVAGQVESFIGPGHAAITVRTTYVPRAQAIAEAALFEALADAGQAGGIGQGAVVVMAPGGAVRAMVGGRAYGESQFNRASQARRQPGSAFKSVVYLAAFSNGRAPDDVLEDAPLAIDGWEPQNYDGRYSGPVTLREAFARSLNTVAVRLAVGTGLSRISRTAARLGIVSDVPADASAALGTGELTLLELTGAYASVARSGIRTLPYGITKIVGRDGEVLYRRSGAGAGALFEPGPMAALHGLLREAVENGTGRAAALGPTLPPAHGKTGTSQDYRDAWFVGFAGPLVAGVWLGNDDGTPMERVTGGGPPARIWQQVMTGLLSD